LTSVIERVPLDRIGQRARQVRPGRVVLIVVASLLVGLGWAACKLCAAAWLVAAWCGSAVVEGWQAAKPARRAP
jgi:uncharacterized membrane protein YedE/YeeE